ncbi:MAG TPA: DUF1444 family protein [Tepidisphaeraceae bacterium]|nr:DUF1444 family protein [Tepidisphaeraceae bacterium]
MAESERKDSDRKYFVEQVVQIVRQRFPLVKIEPMTEAFALKVNGHMASLEHVYRMTTLQPEETKHQIERWMVELLRASEGSPDEGADFNQIKDRVYPMILSGSASDDQRESMVSQPLVGELSVAYALDSDRTMTYILRRHFDEWKIDMETLHQTAIDNLVTRSEAINAQAAQDEDGEINLILFRTMDGYDASRVLLPTLHERLREYLGSPFAAAIPNRDILLCFRNSEPTLSRIREQVHEDFIKMPHHVTDQLLLVTADGIAMHD